VTDILDQIEAEDPEDDSLRPDVRTPAPCTATALRRPRCSPTRRLVAACSQEGVAGDYFQHFACLYIKYCQIYKKLHECHDQVGSDRLPAPPDPAPASAAVDRRGGAAALAETRHALDGLGRCVCRWCTHRSASASRRRWRARWAVC
jgi:hypothetical protein